MTTSEFSNTIDTLLASYSHNAQFGEQVSQLDISLDEYEKSVMLTQAQDIIVKQYFEGTNVNAGFDETAGRQIDFSNLIVVSGNLISSNDDDEETEVPFDSRGIVVTLPDNVLFILNEKAMIGGRHYVVKPINYNEYSREMSKAYTQPLKKQCWRLFQGNSTDVKSEIIPISGNTVTSYVIRYVRRPKPIVLADLDSDGLSVDGEYSVSGCELNPSLHMDIVLKAVELIVTTRGGKQVARNNDDNK